MAYQENWNGFCSYKVQSALNSQASSTGATVHRQTGGTGGTLTKATVASAEVRRDGLSTRGRHGLQKTAGPYTHELSLGGFDQIFEAVMRGTYSSADLTITEASVIGGSAAATSITTTTSTIVAAAGSWITQGLRVGDVIVLTGQATSTTNNSKNLRITGLTALTITVAETLVLNATPDTSFTVTRPGRVLVNPGPGNLVKRYFTVDEYEYDTDRSELFTDCVWDSFKISMAPNGEVLLDTSWVGTGQMEVKASGASPWFTSPTTPTGVPMAVVDATIRMNGIDIVDLTSFDITVTNQATTPDVITSPATPYAPAVFTGTEMITMNLTALRKDLTLMSDFIAETVYSLHVLFCELEAEPKSFISLYVPNFTLGPVQKSALTKQGGARTQTISIPADLIGIDNSGGAFDATAIKLQVSNAS